MNKLVKIPIFLLLLLTSVLGATQNTLYPNVFRHMSCNTILTGAKPIEPNEVKDFAKTDRFDLKLVKYDHGFQAHGEITDQLSALFIDALDYRELWPSGKVDEGYKTYIESLLEKLPTAGNSNQNSLFICTYKNGSQEVITYCYLVSNRIIGYAHPVSLDLNAQKLTKATLIEELESAGKSDTKVFWYGDDIRLDVAEFARQLKINVFRRAKDVPGLLPEKIVPLDKILKPESSAICNALPTTMHQLMNGGHPSTATTLAAWKSYRADIDALTSDFPSRLTSIESLKAEIMEGNTDLVLIIAHLKGANLFIGDRQISLDQIKNWGKRTNPISGNRVAVLCVCNSGNQQYTTGSFFWKTHAEPLANILKANGYFDMVIAPDHVILRPETTSFLQNLLKNKSIQDIQTLFKGWGTWVYNN